MRYYNKMVWLVLFRLITYFNVKSDKTRNIYFQCDSYGVSNSDTPSSIQKQSNGGEAEMYSRYTENNHYLNIYILSHF